MVRKVERRSRSTAFNDVLEIALLVPHVIITIDGVKLLCKAVWRIQSVAAGSRSCKIGLST